MQKSLLKNIFIYVSVLCLLTSIACKKNEEKKINNNTDIIINKKQTINLVKIKDYPKLSNIDSLNFSYTSVSGNDQEALKKNCYSFYSKYWENEIKDEKEVSIENPSFEGLKKIKEIIDSPEIDVTIKLLQNNIAIITRSALGIDGYLGLEKMDDIWIFHSNNWKPLNGVGNISYRKAQLIHLNNDDYIDAIITGGCCDYNELNILIGEKESILSFRQNISINGIYELNYNDKCDIHLIAKSDPEASEEYQTEPKKLLFDCSINGFALSENQ